MKKLLILLVFIILINTVSAYTIYYYHNDNQGNPVAITDEQGEIVWKAEYEPFGSIFNEEEIETSNKYNYNTKELDKNTDLLYYGNRYYDSNLGRFTTADTIKGSLSNPQSLNRYSYTLNNPLKYIDPSGNQGEKPISEGQPLMLNKFIYSDNLQDKEFFTENIHEFVDRIYMLETVADILESVGISEEDFVNILKNELKHNIESIFVKDDNLLIEEDLRVTEGPYNFNWKKPLLTYETNLGKFDISYNIKKVLTKDVFTGDIYKEEVGLYFGSDKLKGGMLFGKGLHPNYGLLYNIKEGLDFATSYEGKSDTYLFTFYFKKF